MIGHGQCGRVMAVAQVLELVGRANQHRLGFPMTGFLGQNPGVVGLHLLPQIPHFTNPRQQTGAGFLAAAHEPIGRQHIPTRRDERGWNPPRAIDPNHLLEIVDEVHARQQATRQIFVAGPGLHALEQRLAQRNDASGFGLGSRHCYEKTAAGFGAPQLVQGRHGTFRTVDHQRPGTLRQHRFDRGFDRAIRNHQVAHQTPHPEAGARLFAALQQVTRAFAQIFALLEHLAQRIEPGPSHLACFAELTQRFGQLARFAAAALVGLESRAQQPHQSIALGEKIAKPRF